MCAGQDTDAFYFGGVRFSEAVSRKVRNIHAVGREENGHLYVSSGHTGVCSDVKFLSPQSSQEV